MKHDHTETERQSHDHSEGEGGHRHHVKHSPEEWAKRLDAPERDGWQKPTAVMELLEITPGQTVAEVGAGTGYFLKYLSAAVGPSGTVRALDVEADLVDYMKVRAKREGLSNVVPARCPFDSPGLEPSSVDRLLIVNTWHHFMNRVTYGRTLLEVLKPEGALFVIDFNKDSPIGPPKEAKLTPEQVISELEKAGFSPQQLAEPLPEQYVIRATRP